jgi:hypothetical protein
LMDDSGEGPGPRDREMEDVRWFPLDEAVGAAGYDSERDILHKAVQAVRG